MKKYNKNEIYYFRVCERVNGDAYYVRVRYEGKSNIKDQGYFWPIDSNWSLGACPDWLIKTKEELLTTDKVISMEV